MVQALARYEKLGDLAGRAQAEVVLGEIDYLLGDHTRGRATLKKAVERCTEVGDVMGRAQSLILLALIEEAVGAFERGRELLGRARASSTASATASGRNAIWRSATPITAASTFPEPRAHARPVAARCRARVGEARCERLLAVVALITTATTPPFHARVAFKIYERLQDPWGELEQLLVAQVALAKGRRAGRDAEGRLAIASCSTRQNCTSTGGHRLAGAAVSHWLSGRGD